MVSPAAVLVKKLTGAHMGLLTRGCSHGGEERGEVKFDGSVARMMSSTNGN